MAKGRKTGGRIAVSNDERFWAKVKKTEECWLWIAYRNWKGYGTFGVRPTTGGRQYEIVQAHRYAYLTLVGPITEGITLDHLCRVRHCVNPSHLEVVTNRENILRGIGPTARNARKTHCVKGHAFTEQNTYQRKNESGKRCRICIKEYNDARL